VPSTWRVKVSSDVASLNLFHTEFCFTLIVANCYSIQDQSFGEKLQKVMNVQYKANWNCHYESPRCNEYILRKKEKSQWNCFINVLGIETSLSFICD
jgi:hypothetical protein